MHYVQCSFQIVHASKLLTSSWEGRLEELNLCSGTTSCSTLEYAAGINRTMASRVTLN